MSQESLKRLRLLVPGLMLTVILEPLLDTSTRLAGLGLPDISEYVGYPLQVFVFGVAYHVLELRRIAFRDPVVTVTKNIENALLKCCRGHDKLLAHEAYLRDRRRLMHVFYRIVDNDATLQEKAKRIRFNGLLWSSFADLQVIAWLSGLAYLIAGAISQSQSLIFASMGLLVVALTSSAATQRTTMKHLALSNEQLEIIIDHHCEDVLEQLNRLVDNANA